MVSDVYFPRINGVSTSIQTFKRELEQLGHRVVLIAPEYPQDYAFEADVIRIPSRAVLLDPEDRMLKKRQALQLLPQLQQYQFDLVHIQTPFVAHYLGLRLARQLGIPAVVSYHTFFEEYLFHYFPFVPKAFMRYLARRFSRTQCNQVDGILVPSTAMAAVLKDYRVRRPMHILPTGIQLEKLCCDPAHAVAFRQRLGIDENRPCLVHVGRIAHEKNIEFLIQVIHRVKQTIPELAVIIAGEGPALAAIKSLVKTLQLEQTVYFVGYLDRSSSLLHCYRAADGFIFASRTETQGLVLLEAMALGVPVVSTAVMGTRDILQPQLGCLVAEETIEDFSARVLQLLGDELLHNRLSRQAIDYVQRWTSTEMAGRMADFYRSVCREKEKIESANERKMHAN
jgi:glycosyltransferase involved in cell wall biosynthesis